MPTSDGRPLPVPDGSSGVRPPGCSPPYLPYLIRRGRESQADSVQRWHEIQTLGYTHSARTVGRFITRLRRAADAGAPPEPQGPPYTCAQGPSARTVSCTLMGPPAKRVRAAQMYLDQVCAMDADIARADELRQGCLAIVRARRGADLEAGMAETINSRLEALARFARGLQEDLAAVTAGLTREWSNGVTEGQVHRLKLVKRQGYGRAGVALLRQRVLQAASIPRQTGDQAEATPGGRTAWRLWARDVDCPQRERRRHSFGLLLILASHHRKGLTLVHQT
jgi:transposase